MTVRDATFDFLRRRGLTDIFSNPGSTEIPFLTGLPDDLNFVLGLHEGSVVSMASGYALARRRPSFALLHTTPGFGNAVNAIATARVNRTPHRDRDRPAGSPPHRVRAVPRRPARRAGRATIPSGSRSRPARRTCRARWSAPTTRRRRIAGRRS